MSPTTVIGLMDQLDNLEQLIEEFRSVYRDNSDDEENGNIGWKGDDSATDFLEQSGVATKSVNKSLLELLALL